MNDQRVGYFFAQLQAFFAVGFQYLDLHIVGQTMCGFLSDTRTAVEHHTPYVVLGFAQLRTQKLHFIARTNGINHIAFLHLILPRGEDGLIVALDEHDAISSVVVKTRVKPLPYDLCSFAHLDHAQFQRAVAKGDMVAHPVGTQRFFYLIGSQHFGINKVVQAHLLEQGTVVGQQILIVVHPSQGLFCTQLIGYQATGYILRLIGCNGYKQVHILRSHLFQIVNRGRTAHTRHQVVVGFQIAQMLGIAVEQADIHIFAREQLGKVCAYFSSACNSDSHNPSWSK